MLSVKLEVLFSRITDNDEAGMITVVSTGWPYDFLYSDMGTHVGVQSNGDDEAKALQFGKELSALLRKHFAGVPSLT
jgi:hypothetical protein